MLMEIAVHTSRYPIDNEMPSGGERVAKRVSEALSEMGHSVTVYTGGEPKTDYQRGITVNRSKPRAVVGKTPVSLSQLTPPKKNPDVIHIHNTTPTGMLSGYLHHKRSGAPIVITHHGKDRVYVPEGASFIKKYADIPYSTTILPTIFEAAEVVTVPSPSYALESPLLQRYDDEKLVYIPNGINKETVSQFRDARKANIGGDLPVVLYLGDVIGKKGPLDLLEAHSEMSNNTHLVIAGKGEQLDEVRKTASGNVSVLGYVSERRKRELFTRADVYCLPSRVPTEVFPLTFLEAYATSTPLVTSDLKTFEPFIEGCNAGVMAKRQNTTDLADKLDQVISDDPLRRNMSENSGDSIRDYYWQDIYREYETILNSVQ